MEHKVIEHQVELQTKDGKVDGFLYSNDTGIPQPGIIFYTDIRGIRQANRDMASRLAAEGYMVLMPNVFFRTARPPVMDPNADGNDFRRRFGELTAPLTPAVLDGDAKAYVGFLTKQVQVIDAPMGVVGYCFTGAFALRTAAALPDTIAAAASFHGGGLYTDQPSSPHLVLPDVKARLYFGHANEDGSMPADSISKFESSLRAWGGEFQSEVYEHARHGWTVPDSQAYARAEAEKAYGRLTSLLIDALK